MIDGGEDIDVDSDCDEPGLELASDSAKRRDEGNVTVRSRFRENIRRFVFGSYSGLHCASRQPQQTTNCGSPLCIKEKDIEIKVQSTLSLQVPPMHLSHINSSSVPPKWAK